MYDYILNQHTFYILVKHDYILQYCHTVKLQPKLLFTASNCWLQFLNDFVVFDWFFLYFFPSSFSSFLSPFLLFLLISTKPSWFFRPILLIHLLSFLLAPDSNDIYFLNARIAFLGTTAEADNPAEIDSPALQPLDQDDYNEGGGHGFYVDLRLWIFTFYPSFLPYSHFL